MLEPLRSRRHNSACFLPKRGTGRPRGLAAAVVAWGGTRGFVPSARGDTMEEQVGVGRVKGLGRGKKWLQAQGPSWHGRKHRRGFTPGFFGHWKESGGHVPSAAPSAWWGGKWEGEQLWETKRKMTPKIPFFFSPPSSCSCSLSPKLANPGMDPPAGSHREQHGCP